MANRALCVGINDYPGSNMDLAGCVNDAKDWQALLEQRGYRVDALHDGEATRARIVEALKAVIGQAGDDDSLVFTFSGHGSWLPDDDRDEPDARDEMMCPARRHEASSICSTTICMRSSAPSARAPGST